MPSVPRFLYFPRKSGFLCEFFLNLECWRLIQLKEKPCVGHLHTHAGQIESLGHRFAASDKHSVIGFGWMPALGTSALLKEETFLFLCFGFSIRRE